LIVVVDAPVKGKDVTPGLQRQTTAAGSLHDARMDWYADFHGEA
jgi:hypothetical protein